VLLALAMGSVIQAAGWAQTSNFALVRALSHGSAKIDPYSWETRDSSYYQGHFYSVKAPGMAFLVLPFYAGLKAVGAESFSKQMALNARESGALRWYRAGVPSGQYAGNLALARETRSRIEFYTPLVWMLGLLVVVIPALILMLIVRSLGDVLAPGFGALAAVATGAGTLILPFSTLFFSHVLAATLVLGAFAVLWRERERETNLKSLLAAGLLCGFAVTTEYPLALAGVVLGVYAISRQGFRERAAVLRRGAIYSAGAVLGVVPLLAYNVLAFGSVSHFSYADAVALQGESGHDKLGLNSGGFFGIDVPSLHNAFDLLFSVKGLFVAAPVLLLAFVGLVLMKRDGRRAEAYVIGSIFALYLLYNSGYWLPFGGGSPGPRFLIPVIPFLGIALAPAFRRLPATALALLVPSVLVMATATVTLPMIGNGDVGLWVHLVGEHNYEQTIVSVLGADNNLAGLLPFLICLTGSLLLAIYAATPLRVRKDAVVGAASVLVWALAAAIAPHAPAAVTVGEEHSFAPLIWTAIALAFVLIGAVLAIENWPRRRDPVLARDIEDDQVAAAFAGDS
jgi:hypothetical protein